MRIAVVGLGIAGAMTAWRLARAGHEVIGYDPYPAVHPHGSSHGESRVIRRIYPDPYYTRLMNDSYALWDELVKSVGNCDLIHYCGGLYFGPIGHPNVSAAIDAMQLARAPHAVLAARECRGRYPALRIQNGEIGLYDPEMGYARASECVVAARRLAETSGAVLHVGAPVTAIGSSRDGNVRVHTVETEQAFDRVVITGGSWTNPLLANFGFALPLTVTRQVYANIGTEGSPGRHRERNFPVWIDAVSLYYGFPELAPGAGVKIAQHVPGPTTTSATVDRMITDEDREPIQAYACGRIEGLSEIVSEGTCLYTNTPDEDFVIDRVPGEPNIIVATACSGHGFKFAPLVGDIAARLASNDEMPYDISRFGIARFGM